MVSQEEEYEAAEELVETDESLGLAGILDPAATTAAARRGAAAAKAADMAGLTGASLVMYGDGRSLISTLKSGEVESDDSEEEGDGGAGAAGVGTGVAASAPGLFEEQVEMPVRFQILKDEVDNVKKACRQMDPPFPLMREYDFKACSLPELDIRLRSPELLREYAGNAPFGTEWWHGVSVWCVRAQLPRPQPGEDVWQWARAFRHHRAAVRCGQDACGHLSCSHHPEVMPGGVPTQHQRGAVD